MCAVGLFVAAAVYLPTRVCLCCLRVCGMAELSVDFRMFQTFAQHFTQLDFLGARYYDNVNDGFDGNNNATDSL